MKCPMENGSALVLGEDSNAVNKLICDLLKEETLPEPVEICDSTFAYPWQIDTKYYTTSINICSTTKQPDSQLNPDFSSTIQAAILLFKDSLEYVESWMPFLKSEEIDVQILVCDECQKTKLSHKEVLDWCIKNHFELVELNPILETDEEEFEDDFQETTGINRIIQALHSHVWPQLELKDPVSDSLHINQTENKNTTEPDRKQDNLPIDNEDVMESLVNADVDDQKFDELFQNFCQMKDKAASLSFEERKKFAEEVTIQFWKAVGGDEDEISGLSDN